MSVQLRQRQYRSKFDRRYSGGPNGEPPEPENPWKVRLVKIALILAVVAGVIASYFLFQ